MSVFKATKNRKEVGGDTFKATERRSYDSTMVYDWQKANEESTALLNTYTTKIQKGEYLSAEDLESYRTAIDSYIDSSTNLRDLSKALGTSSKEEDDATWQQTFTDLQSNFKLASEYYSKYDSEDAFKKAVEDQKKYEAQHAEWMSLDLKAAQVELDNLYKAREIQTKINTLKNKKTDRRYAGLNGESFQAEIDEQIAELENELSQYGDINTNFGQKALEFEVNMTLAERAQKAAELASVADIESENYDPAFAEKSQYQSTKFTAETFWDKFHSTEYSLGYDDLTHEYINGDEDFRAEVRSKYRTYSRDSAYDDGKSRFEEAGYDYMSEGEIALYNYYYNTEGKEKAEEYLDSIAESLHYQSAEDIAQSYKGKPVLQYMFAVEAGLDQFASGVAGWFADGYTPASSIQIASGMVREDLADTGAKLPDWLGGSSLGQVGYDVINTASNMLPSILASTAANVVAPGSGAIVGATLMGASAGGNARVEMLNLGYSKEQATSYGIMVGVAEASMEYLLGNIPGVSKGDGIFSTLGTKVASKVDNAISRVAIKLGNNGTSFLRAVANGAIKVAGGALDEGLEEGLQTIIEPWLKEIATGVDWDAPNIDEILYSSLLGALSSVALGGFGDASGQVKTIKSGKNIQQVYGGVAKLQELGTTFSADTVAYKIASEVNSQTDAYTIGRLLNEVGATISEQNLTDIVNGLTAKGMDTKTATKLAKQYQAFLSNEMRMTDEQVKILENLSPLADVLRTNIIGSNTTVYQRTRAYSDLMSLADEVSSGKKSKASKTAETPTGTIKPSTNIFEQKDINTELQRIATEVATGSRSSASERAVKKVVDSASSAAEARLGVEGRYNYSDTGATRLANSNQKVNIVGVDSIEDGTMKLKLDDGSIVSADEISFSSSDEALVYEAVTNMGVSANTAWDILKEYDPKSGQSGTIYAMGALEAYTYGHNGVKVDGMSKDGFSALLTPVQRNTANRLGDIDARAKVDAQQKTIDKAVKSVRDEAKSKGKAIPKRKGEVVFEGDYERLTDLQRSQFDVLGKVSEGLGVTFHIFESKVDAKGKRYYKMPDGKITSANGWYDPKTGEIWIDLYAGNDGQGTMIFTAAHELTHFIRQWSPAKFKVFADFLFEQYGKKGQDVNQLVREQMQKAANNGRSISWDEAYEEVVADSTETFLRDSKAAEKIAALREKDAGLANKIKSFLGQMLAKMRKVMADLGLAPETKEGKMVAEMTDSLQKLYDLWTDALADAGEAYSTLADIDLDTESVAPMLSERTWTASEYVTEREATAKKISEALGVDMKTAYKYIDDINGVARLIADDRARLDYEPNLDEHATVLKPNSEYKYSVDMSTLCAKRLLFTGTFDAIQKALPNTVFDSEDIVALREMMQKRGYEVACGICYVESTRREIGRITQEFIDRYKVAQATGKPISRINSSGKEVVLKSAGKTFNADKNYTPNLGELNTTDIDIVKRDHPEVYDAYLAFMNARGQAKPKLLETRAEYKGEILKHFKAKSAVEARNNAGGLRLQSFSDFEVPHLIDMMQIVMDMSRVGLKSQAYTKVPAFAEVFGDTGVKINLSLIAKGDGLDANGNLVFDDVEGINHKEAFKLRDKYSKNVGTILVGKTDAHIIAAMADPRIDYIIPFHKSSWKESLYDALGLTGYADYTDFQNEKPIDKDRKIKNFDPSEYWDFSKSGDENAQIYLAKCREDGRIPKFPQFQGYPGYWKLLIDFKMYDNDGVGSPQEVVRPTFNTEASERILSEYKGGHKSFPVAKDVVEDFVKEHKSKNNTSENNGIRYMDRDGEVKDATQLSVKDLEYLLEQAQYGELKDRHYIPLRRNTPEFFIEVVKDHSKGTYFVEDYPIASQVEHIRQNMEEEDGQSYGNHRPHGFSIGDIITISRKMGDPSYIVKQENERYAMVVSFYNKRNKRVVVSIDFADPHSDPPKNYKYTDYINKYNSGYYNIVVTQYEPDDFQDYLSKCEVIYDKTKMNGKYQVGSGRVLTVTHDTPFIEDIIPQPDDSVNRDTKKNSLRDSYAPIFYSQMGKVIDDIKLEKMGASSILNHLKNRGVKNEEIKWSGIEAFLEGKKSVTKKELQEFIAGSQLQIEEQMSGRDIELRYDHSTDSYTVFDGNGDVIDTYSYDSNLGGYTSENDDEVYEYASDLEKEMRYIHGSDDAPRHSQYKLDGGRNYRELVFKIPNSSYSNIAMQAHWGEDAEGVLAHARIQDITTDDGKKMLFVEEIQSDWHNEGQKNGYRKNGEKTDREIRVESDIAYEKFYQSVEKILQGKGYDFNPALIANLFYGEESAYKFIASSEMELTDEELSYIKSETTKEERRQKTLLNAPRHGSAPDAPFRTTYHEYVLKRLLRMAAEEGYDSLGWTTADIQSERWSDEYAEGYRIEYDQDIPSFLKKYGKKWGASVGKTTIYGDTDVWSMPITNPMKKSVLTEGQAMFSDRSPDSVSTRSLLANALETTVQNDIERNKLEEYKGKIDLIESEYEKLTKLKAEIKELSFAKGKRDTARIKELQFQANQTANRINTYDRQLLNLESTTALKNVLQREKELARRKEAQKGKEALAKYKEKAAKTQRELMERNTESRKKAIEGRNKTEMKHKIQKVVGDLKSLLLDPTKDKHVPIGLQKPVAEALDIINMDTLGADERVAKYNAMIAKANDPDIIAELTKSRDRIALQGENLADKLNALKQAYADIKNSDDPLVRDSHNEAIEDLIANTAEKVGNTSLRDMSYEQLEAVYDMYKAILATIRNANKMFKATKQETITDNSESVKREVRVAGGHRDRVLKATKFLKKFGWNMLKPIYAMKLIGSDTLTRLYENVRKGEDTWAVDVNEAKEFFKETASKYNYNSWDFKKQYKFEDSAGQSFSLSLEQIMSLYAYSKREQADKHLEVGGFIFDDAIEVIEKTKLGIPMKYEVNDANPYRLKKEDLGKVIGILDTDLKDVKGFVDEMQTYLSDVMGAKGNEVSLAMYDIKLYKEKYYFPLKTAKYFREFDPEKNGTPKIKNSGFSKKTVPQAGNPIILSNFMDVWANHVNDMSMYHAFVLPLEDFMRVYNYSSTMGGYDSVQQYIKNAYGSQANTYIETLMNDLNGGARTDPAADPMSKGISLFKKGKVFASLSVIVQQPSAIARALAYIDTKYFIDKPEATKHKETWAEVKKYAPVAIIKEMGYFDTNMGRSTVDWIRDEKTWRDKVDDSVSKAPALADELAWCAIWKAVKREVSATTNLKVGSEEFLKMAGKRFTEVVTKTQVYDSVLSRSAMMRSKDTGMKMATAFMAEPTTSLNMVIDAIIEGKRGNKKFARKAVGAVAASVILNSILVSLVYAARDDDEDETYLEKYLESLTTELIDGLNPITYIPFAKDIWSIAQGFDVERTDMSIVGDLWEATEGLFSNNKSGYEKVEGFAGSVANMFGLPLKNVLRDVRGIYNLVTTLISGTPTTWTGVGKAVGGAVKSSVPLYSRIVPNDSKSDNLYDAIVSGDQKHIERMKAQYEDDKEYLSAIKQALRENDSRIREAAQAVIEGNHNERIRIQKEIIAEKNFKQDIIVTATNAEIAYVRQKINDARKAKKAGDDDEYNKIVKALTKRGYPKDFIKDALK